MLEDYLKRLPQPLNKETQMQLINEYKKTGSIELRNKILSHNLRFAAFVIQTKFPHVDGYETEDLIQLANIALVSAIENYSPEKNITFASYAGVCIENAIKTELRTASHHSLKPDFYLYDELKEYSPLTKGESVVTLDSVIADETESHIERDYILRSELERVLRYAKSKLSERDYNLFLSAIGYHNSGQPNTLSNLGKEFNLSHQRASEIISRATQIIRRRFIKEAEELFSYEHKF